MFKKSSRRHLFKLNNNGSTMMIVMVAVSLIGVLATVLMSMSYMNYNMKVTELNSKKNFYTAEIVLDQINLGLQREVSESLEDAYIRAMQRYTIEDDNTRNTNFANYYIGELRNRLKDTNFDSQYQIAAVDTDMDGVYDKGLVSYLDIALQNAYDSGDLVITSSPKATGVGGDITMESVARARTNALTGNTEYESQGLVLYNLRIEYTDANLFTTVIETDIRLETPELTLVTKTAMPEVFEYSIVADAGILGSSAGGTTTFKGNVYAGNDTGVTTDDGGLSVTQGHTWNFEGENKIVSAGPLRIATTATVNATADTECWFESIHLPKNASTASGKLSLLGSTYVADDLTIEGKLANVTLAGKYYGFGNAAEAAGSSAIILNGKDATLDMSGLEKLMLGGNAYVQTSQISYTPNAHYTAGNNKDILLGNSIAVKSDQIVYLVPAECIGVRGNEILIGKNPMTEDKYLEWKDYNQRHLDNEAGFTNYEAVSLTKDIDNLGKSISEYAYNSVGYKTVFRQVNGQTLCYVYWDLTEEGAANYYQDYYNAATVKMNRYISAYNNRIVMNPDLTDYESNGNLLLYSLGTSGAISIVDNTIDSSREAMDLYNIEREQTEFQERFLRLKAKLALEESAVTSVELSKTIYENTINSYSMGNLPNNSTGVTYPTHDPTDPEDIPDPDELKAVFVNNAGKANYIYNDPNVRVIIATGNVELRRNFEGLIICDGKIIINGASEVKPNKLDVLQLLRLKESEDDDAMSLVARYFIDGDRYSMDSTLSGTVTNTMNGQQMGELIIYENWSKQ